MAQQRRKAEVGPRGGLRVNQRTRSWNWNARGRLVSKPVRCRREEWYLARAQLNHGAGLRRADVLTVFLREDEVIGQRCLRLVALRGDEVSSELVGWLQTPEEATHLQLALPDLSLAGHVEELVLHDVAERDPKCHPLANVPRWDVYRPPFPLERVILPASLAELAGRFEWLKPEIVRAPRSAAELRRRARGAACIVDPAWVRALRLTLTEVEAIAAVSWLMVDLETLARLLRGAGACDAQVVTHADAHGLMSARHEYADVPTRGLALQDVVPYAVLDARGGFQQRALRASRSWKRYAEEHGFAPLLAGETPWEEKCGDVLSAARPIGRGELLATDLPWLVAERFGWPVAPRIATHLLRMHLGGPLPDHVQYWNRWESGDVIVRDISDLARRYSPLQPVRWASETANVAHLGLALAGEGPPRAHVLLQTGRIDGVDAHDGVPPEPMMIFMKWAAREAREGTAWARRHLAGRILTWQFDTWDGLKYAVNFDSAAVLDGPPVRIVTVRVAGGAAGAGAGDLTLPEDEGLHGDGALEFQDALVRNLGARIAAGAD